ncbi:MAG: hypothetical protein HOI95_18690, partial [Chromatiales bacterium]|nr:hypothetical protein [Chromatiales bacterium]
AGVAVAATECGLQPISQHALVIWNELSYYDYGGPGVIETPEDIGNACGASNCVVMRNHGLLTQGHTIQSAFFRMYYLELACQIQADAKAMNEPLRAVSGDVLQASIDVYAERNSADDLGQREWPSLLRMLERQGSNYLA